MKYEEALPWANTILSSHPDDGGLTRVRAGTHSGGQYCAELVTGPGYPDENGEPLGSGVEPRLLDYEFSADPRRAIQLVLFRRLCALRSTR